jgi:hypothetical protein
MDYEENETKPSENNIIHISAHVLTKQINHLLRTLNPQIKSSNLNAHFYQLIQTLITLEEFRVRSSNKDESRMSRIGKLHFKFKGNNLFSRYCWKYRYTLCSSKHARNDSKPVSSI